MGVFSDRGRLVFDIAYGLVILAVIWVTGPSGPVAIGMISFGMFVLLVNWVETRQLVRRFVRGPLHYAIALGVTLALLSTWFFGMTRTPTELHVYFVLLAGFFTLEAVRDVVVLSANPLQLLFGGYVSLIGACLILGAVAATVDFLDLGLILVVAFVYLVRKSFQWTGAFLNWVVSADTEEE